MLSIHNARIFSRSSNRSYVGASVSKHLESSSKLHRFTLQGSCRTFMNRNLKPKSNTSTFRADKNAPGQQSRVSQLFKPFCFTAAFTVTSYSGAALYHYEDMRSRAWALYSEQTDWWLNRDKAGRLRQLFNEYWNLLHDGQKTAAGIIFLNCLVFLAWRVPSLQPKMMKYFVCNPAAKSVLPMVLSTFSHSSFLHLAINMYVLFSFSSAVGHVLGKEQFIATYLSAGAISSFASLLCKVATSKASVSLGASGAILGILGFTCSEFPDSRLSIVFLPFFTFTAANAIAGVIALDAAGILFNWTLFDHAAHLGGTLFGIWYSMYGKKIIWEGRGPLMKQWHEFRNKRQD